MSVEGDEDSFDASSSYVGLWFSSIFFFSYIVVYYGSFDVLL